MKMRGTRATDWTAESLALHTQAVLQGAFILAKARSDSKTDAKKSAKVAAESVDHLRLYVELLFADADGSVKKKIK